MIKSIKTAFPADQVIMRTGKTHDVSKRILAMQN